MQKITQVTDKVKDKHETLAKKAQQIAGESSQSLVADDTSVVSALSNAISEGGSQRTGSVIGSLKSGARDSDSEISVLQKKYAGAVEKFILETCTVIVFVSVDGQLTEYPLKYRITTYSDLQREIARIRPRSVDMYIIQDINGTPISAKRFTGYDVIRVKEICTRPLPSMLRTLPIDWEMTRYHAVAEPESEPVQYVALVDDNMSFCSQPLEPSDLD